MIGYAEGTIDNIMAFPKYQLDVGPHDGLWRWVKSRGFFEWSDFELAFEQRLEIRPFHTQPNITP